MIPRKSQGDTWTPLWLLCLFPHWDNCGLILANVQGKGTIWQKGIGSSSNHHFEVRAVGCTTFWIFHFYPTQIYHLRYRSGPIFFHMFIFTSSLHTVIFGPIQNVPSTWRIIPVSKWLGTPIYKPFRSFGRGITSVRGLTITMVINHLQVLGWSWWLEVIFEPEPNWFSCQGRPHEIPARFGKTQVRSPGLWIKTSLKLGLLQQKTLNLNFKRKSKSKSPGRENSGFLLVFDELISEGLLVGGWTNPLEKYYIVKMEIFPK